MKKKCFSKKEFSCEFIKFAIIGILNTIIHLAILYSLTEYFHVYYLISSTIGFIFAVTNSFIFNTLWTFKKNIKERIYSRYTKFFIISTIAAIISVSLLYLITELFGIWYVLSQLIATTITLTINFMGNKFWTYR